MSGIRLFGHRVCPPKCSQLNCIWEELAGTPGYCHKLMLPQHTHTLNYEAAHKRRINKIIFQAERKKLRQNRRQEEKSCWNLRSAHQVCSGCSDPRPLYSSRPRTLPHPKKNNKKPSLFQSSGKICCTSVEPICSYQKIKKNVPAEVANKRGYISGA